jgi:hypothetical protein
MFNTRAYVGYRETVSKTTQEVPKFNGQELNGPSIVSTRNLVLKWCDMVTWLHGIRMCRQVVDSFGWLRCYEEHQIVGRIRREA